MIYGKKGPHPLSICKHSTRKTAPKFSIVLEIYLSKVVCGEALSMWASILLFTGRHTNICYAYMHISITRCTKIISKQIQLSIIK